VTNLLYHFVHQIRLDIITKFSKLLFVILSFAYGFFIFSTLNLTFVYFFMVLYDIIHYGWLYNICCI